MNTQTLLPDLITFTYRDKSAAHAHYNRLMGRNYFDTEHIAITERKIPLEGSIWVVSTAGDSRHYTYEQGRTQ